VQLKTGLAAVILAFVLLLVVSPSWKAEVFAG